MRSTLTIGALLLAAPALGACAATGSGDATAADSSPARTLTVSSTDDACELSATTASAGPLTFDVTNAGSKVTEFYLLASDGARVVAEVENIGPALSRQLVVDLSEGSYLTSCKPGASGEGIRAGFEVTPATDGAKTASAGLARRTDTVTVG